MKILHCFADEGVESEVLSAYGDVYRIGLDPSDTNDSQPIQADATSLPFKEGATFDLGLFHPPCQRWTPGAQMNGTTENHDNLIPEARNIAQEYCDHHIIENVPQAPLKNPIYLDGQMFGSPLVYERAFETNYHVPQPPRQKTFADASDRIERHHEMGGFTGSKQMWKSLKGYSGEYDSRSFKRSAIPRSYIDYLIRPLL